MIVLVILVTLNQRRLPPAGDPPTGSGAVAMAVGIFVLGALQQMPFPVRFLTRSLTVGSLLIWAYLAAAYVASYFRGTFHAHTDDPVGVFAVGTWVAGTAVPAELIVVAWPEWRPLALVLALIAGGVWLWYLGLIARGYRRILASATRLNTTGRVLLATVSTQALLLLAEQLFADRVPAALAQSMIGLGLVFYILGVILIVQRYQRQHGWHLADDWDNTNCILHGAMSITGLAAAVSQGLPLPLVMAMWGWAAGAFVIVELIELARLISRVRLYGWHRGAATYHVSQWARNFTFGMFYAFTLRLHARLEPAGAGAVSWPAAVQAAIVGWGQYVVLALLLIEAGLFLKRMLAGTTGRPGVRPA